VGIAIRSGPGRGDCRGTPERDRTARD